MASYYTSSKATPTNWEASLKNIIERTNNNLNAMSSSSSSRSTLPTPSRYSSAAAPPPRHSVGSPVVSAPSRKYANNNQNPPPPAPPSSKGNDQNQHATVSASSADQIEANVMNQVRQLISDKFVIVERSVDSLRQQIVGLSSEVSR